MAELIAGEISENGSYELRRKMLNFSFGSRGGAFGSLLVLNAGNHSHHARRTIVRVDVL